MRYLTSAWCNLAWSPWARFDDPATFRALPRTGGLYRVRPTGDDSLVYIGQTGRDLGERLTSLRRGTMAAEMPFNDPHTAAPSLWALRDAHGLSFECAAAPVEILQPDREALECYLLWQYRLEAGESTRCNHGRFHPRYVKSSDRKKGQRGYRLPDALPDNPAGGPSRPPLEPHDQPTGPEWGGLRWTAPARLNAEHVRQVPAGPGVYRIIDVVGGEVIYIGESASLRQRLSNHAQKDWEGEATFSLCHLPSLDLAYQRHEVENDLIGGFWASRGRAPRFQFQGHSRR